MDLGIEGRNALVCGSTDGLGLACATALAQAGCKVIINGRTPARVEAAQALIAEKRGVLVGGIAADVTTKAGREALFANDFAPDILVTNAGGPPQGHIEDWDEAEWHGALQANMVSPILLIKKALPGMRAGQWGRVLNITSGAVKSPLPLLGLSNGARTGLTGFVSGLAREEAIHGITINNLLPGYFRTSRLERYAQALADQRGLMIDQIWEELRAKSPTRRIGDPAEFGSACAFLASAQAGFINAQNLLLDGGAFPGTL